MINLQYYIKKVHSVSDYFVSLDSRRKNEVVINISEQDEDGKDVPKHLIITGINGTGKTILLESINQAIRKKYNELMHYRISAVEHADVSTTLSFCDEIPDYFEGIFITVDDMFMPTRGINFNDFSALFSKVSKHSETLLTVLETGLRGIYGNDFERYDSQDEKIVLKGHKPFRIKNMSSGHYSFLNVYCHIRFYQFILQWEDKAMWEYLHNTLAVCKSISESIAQQMEEFKHGYTGTISRDLKPALDNERERAKSINIASNIAESRYKAVSQNSVGERSRTRDIDFALELSRANELSQDETYSRVQRIGGDFDISALVEEITSKLRECLDKLLHCDFQKNDFPLIILIDEPELHLHIALQKEILPYLVRCLPNAQFIVATHSPFVITSLPDATLFNMENRETLNNDLTLYSYENIVEGWFGISTCNDETKQKYAEFKKLAERAEELVGDNLKHYVELYSLLIKTDFISSVMRINLIKELKDDKIYVLR